MLLDTRASANIIQLDIQKKLGLLIRESKTRIKPLSGPASQVHGICKNVNTGIGHIRNVTDFHIMDNTNIPLVFGQPYIRRSRMTFEYPEEGMDAGAQLAIFTEAATGRRGRILVTYSSSAFEDENEENIALSNEGDF